MFVGGLLMATILPQHCEGYHDGGRYYDHQCSDVPGFINASSKVCCTLPCGSVGNDCQTLRELGADITLGAGIGMTVLGALFFFPGIAACVQNAKALKAEQNSGTRVLVQEEPQKMAV